MLSSTPAVALLVLSAITLTGYDSAAAETIPCESVLPGHKMTASPTKKYTFVDGRSILGKTYDVGGCGPTAGYLTGTAYQTNYTFMSYNSPVTSPACLVKKSGDKGIYDSFQAVVMEAHGFQWTPKFSVDDIDALPTTAKYQGEVDTWRESALAFGVSKGKVAYPSLAFSSGTMLKQKTYTITAAALAEMGLGALGELDVVGSEFDEDKPFYNCPFSDAATSSRCRMTVAFAEPIDKLVILYGAAHKSRQDPDAAIFFSELALPCMCMCSSVKRRGMMYTEIPSSPGMCSRIEDKVERERTACDMLATEKVCTFEYKDTFARTGPAAKNGLFPCSKVVGPTMVSEQPYFP